MSSTRRNPLLMVYAIGEAHGNRLLATRIYQANNPGLQRYPLTKCFVKLKERFDRTANANYEKTTRTHECSNQDSQIDIVACVVQNPSTSVREISDELSISKSVVNRTLKKNKFHPYHLEHHQFLTQQDYEKRVQFCEWATTNIQDENFFSKVLFSDESSFTNTGRENRHNYHQYADHNPRLIRQDDHQHRFKVNVWAGICGEYVIGPYFFEENLTGNVYLQFLQNDLPQLQRHIPPDILNSQWFQHDGAPAHSTLTESFFYYVREYLNGLYPDKWIGRGGPIPWPPRSPDLSCLDFFLWGYIKDRVYETLPTDVEDLKVKIRNAFLTVTPKMLRNVLSNFRRRIAQCLETNGNHFERLPVNY